MRLKRQTASIAGVELRRNTVDLGKGGNLELFEEMHTKIIQKMDGLIQAFIKGDNETVRQNLTRSFYQEISIQLSSTKYLEDELANKYRFFISNTLDAVQQGLLNYIECSNKDLLLNQYKQKSEILDDNDKLVQYLESRKRRATIFPERTVTVPVATLKPQYAEYIKRYGVPDGLRFDGIRMREIVSELINMGVLSISEFIA